VITNEQVQAFWESQPLGAAMIDADPGTPEFYRVFDALREADNCEPYELSNRIHGYEDAHGLRVLDLGCGNGYVLSRYARNGAHVAGVDITSMARELTVRRFEIEGLPCDVRETDGDTLPFDDESFDIVCSMGVLHHIEDPVPMVGEIFRVLRPGGRLIMMLYYTNSWKRRIVLPLKWLLLSRYRGRPFQELLNANDGDGCPWVRTYSRDEARDLLGAFEDHSFELNQLSWRQLFLVPGLGTAFARVLPPASSSWPAKAMGWNLYINARRPNRPGAGKQENDIGKG
jgi:SAM-dependent methyltransferase